MIKKKTALKRGRSRYAQILALALDQGRPIDLLSSPVGADLVERLLSRVEHGVYVNVESFDRAERPVK